jgi:hypothetical protein
MSVTKALTLYDLTRRRLREALADRLPGQADIETMLTAYAYWVCSDVDQPGAEWEAALRKCTEYAVRDAELEIEAEQREFALLRHTLPKGRPILDIGAGWGRLAILYNELDMRAVYVEPSMLGVQLMRRSQLDNGACLGEELPFLPPNSRRFHGVGRASPYFALMPWTVARNGARAHDKGTSILH